MSALTDAHEALHETIRRKNRAGIRHWIAIGKALIALGQACDDAHHFSQQLKHFEYEFSARMARKYMAVAATISTDDIDEWYGPGRRIALRTLAFLCESHSKWSSVARVKAAELLAERGEITLGTAKTILRLCEATDGQDFGWEEVDAGNAVSQNPPIGTKSGNGVSQNPPDGGESEDEQSPGEGVSQSGGEEDAPPVAAEIDSNAPEPESASDVDEEQESEHATATDIEEPAPSHDNLSDWISAVGEQHGEAILVKEVISRFGHLLDTEDVADCITILKGDRDASEWAEITRSVNNESEGSLAQEQALGVVREAWEATTDAGKRAIKKRVSSWTVGEAIDLEAAFNQFWAEVHLKKGKPTAKQALARAIDRKAQEEDWSRPKSAQYIIDAMHEFAASAEASPTDHSPIHPTRWLNDGRYDDDRSTWGVREAKPKHDQAQFDTLHRHLRLYFGPEQREEVFDEIKAGKQHIGGVDEVTWSFADMKFRDAGVAR